MIKSFRFLAVLFVFSFMAFTAGFSANIIKINSVKDFGTPFVRLVIDGGCINPILGLGGNIEFPDLFGFMSLSASCYWGPFSLSGDTDTDSHSYYDEDITNVGGTKYYKTEFMNLGFAGFYYGAKLGITLAKEKAMENQRVTIFSESIGYNLIRYFYFNVETPVYYRHMISAELTFEPIGNASIMQIDTNYYYDDAETNYFVNNATVGLLKVMYQWEMQCKYGVKYNYQIQNTALGSDQSSTSEMYTKVFVGPMASLDFKGFGGYIGTEMGIDYLYVRLEAGFLIYQDRPVYVPFKCNIGFFLPIYTEKASEVDRGSRNQFEI